MLYTMEQFDSCLNDVISHHLSGIELQLLTKIGHSMPREACGSQDFAQPYQKSLEYTARIVGVCKDTIRRALDKLHGLGMILINGMTWDEYRFPKEKRRPTGLPLEVRFSAAFHSFLNLFANVKEEVLWPFEFGEAFKEKVATRLEKKKEAKERYLDTLLRIRSYRHIRYPVVLLTEKRKRLIQSIMLEDLDPAKIPRIDSYLADNMLRLKQAHDMKTALKMVAELRADLPNYIASLANAKPGESEGQAPSQ